MEICKNFRGIRLKYYYDNINIKGKYIILDWTEVAQTIMCFLR